MKQLEGAHELMPLRIRHLLLGDLSDLPKHERELARTLRELDEEKVIWQLEMLRDHCDALIREIPKNRLVTERIQALENVAGRTPEEAAAYLEKARRLRAGLTAETA